MAAAQLARRFDAIGGTATLRLRPTASRCSPTTATRCWTCAACTITDPLAMETEINQWPGVVTVGLFARHRASLCLLGTAQGVQTLVF